MSQFNQFNNDAKKTVSNAWLYYLGSYLVFALILGGGTTKGLYTDYILQLAALPMIAHLVLRYQLRTTSALVTVLLGGILAIFAFQLFPNLSSDSSRLAFVTIDYGRTIDSALYTLTLVAVFYSVYSLGETERARVAPFLFLGLVLNFVFSIAQFSANKTGFIIPGLPYVIGGGFFANYNHLASLFYVSIPFIVLAFRNRRFSVLSVPIVGVLLLFLLAIGSLAGVLLGVVSLIISYVFLGNSRALKIATIAILVATALAFSPSIINELSLEGRYALSRSLFAQNTLEAIWQYLPGGSGFGTFELVYPKFAVDTGLFAVYVNHAHNDYLELLLEGGIPAGILLVLYMIALTSVLIRGNLSGLQTVAFIGISFLLIHSAVDYPLRTLAMGTVFAFFNALALAKSAPLRKHHTQ